MSVVDRRATRAVEPGTGFDAPPEVPMTEMCVLGEALSSRSGDIAATLLHRLETWTLERDDSPITRARRQGEVRRISTEATTALARYLSTGEPTPPDQVRRWSNQSSAPFHGVLPLAELTKLTLHWYRAVGEVIGQEAERLGTCPAVVRAALDAARIGCDSSLVTMAKHFDAELSGLRAELSAEQARLAHHDLHDSLTGLANRMLLSDRVAHALRSSERRDTVVAVLFVDLDQFKAVNDVAGHSAGDSLLVEVAKRLNTLVRPSDTVARFGGDEFVVLCEDIGSPQDEASGVAKRIIEALAEPFVISGRELFASASIGIAIGRPGDDPEGLISQADAAMYLAKQRGRARFETYEPALDEGRARRAELANSLHRALERGELDLHYQPVKRIASQTLVTMEALLRWHHGTLGQVPPVEFIPIAEETGLIVELGRWVLGKACQDCCAWRRAGNEVGVSINLSARQLTDPDLVEDVRVILDQTGLDPSAVTFELTESILVTGAGGSRAALEQLKRLGVRLAIDDFGTGYSSLSYLAELPVDDLKIDRSFVSRLGRDAQSLSMIGAVVELAHALGLSVVAEGVETAAELAELERSGCDEAQGYLLGRPHPLSSHVNLDD
jgi:diguanylate cyclase (GGDEF)-like protein